MSDQANVLAMHAAHGVTVGRTCSECVFFVSYQRPHASRGNVSVRMCVKSPQPTRTHKHATVRRPVWARTWSACGLFVEGES